MLEQRVLEFFQTTCPVRTDDKLLVAVSGGPDSVALLHLLLGVSDTLGVTLDVAHIDHGLRGREAEEDAEFVAALAAENELTLHSRRVDIPALLEEESGSVEAVARRERYRFLREARAVAGARWIVTGHSADDQVETFLMNLLRGAGPRGLGGMLPAGPGPMCRPLLTTTKQEILEFLGSEEIQFRLDSTNGELSFTRNRVRERLVPLLTEEFGPAVLGTLARESRLMNELDDFLSAESDHLLRELGREGEEGVEIRIDVPRLRELPPVLARSVIRAGVEDLAGNLAEFTLHHFDQAFSLCQGEPGTRSLDLPRGLLARREYDTLVLTSASGRDDVFASPEATAPLELGGPGEIRWGRVHLSWSVLPPGEVDPVSARSNEGFFDLSGVARPVYLRAAEAGDRLEPLGMDGSQKVSHLLINRKVPRHLRTWIPVLCDNGGPQHGERILWVVGQRQGRHASVGPETSQVLFFKAETIV